VQPVAAQQELVAVHLYPQPAAAMARPARPKQHAAAGTAAERAALQQRLRRPANLLQHRAAVAVARRALRLQQRVADGTATQVVLRAVAQQPAADAVARQLPGADAPEQQLPAVGVCRLLPTPETT